MVLALMVPAWVALSRSAAFAVPVPPEERSTGQIVQAPPIAPVRVVEVGSPMWQFLLVAVAAAVLAIVVQDLVTRRNRAPRTASHPV